MNFRNLLRAGCLALAVCSTGAAADALWLAPAGTTLRLHAGVPDAPRTPDALEAVQASRAGEPLTVASGALAASPAASVDTRLSARRLGPDGEPVIYLARFGRNETEARNALELVPTEAGGNRFVLIWQGRVVPASKVLVSTSAGWRRTLLPATDGSVTLPTPFPALYVLEIAARASGPAAAPGDDPRYANARYVATLSFEAGR
ncbi:hypothetical protein [Chitinasiproducens palmae]|uniref:DUF4198 domain-containing protein n=1 Tax=Chitinasiproducens palmae TaxID=1770053 RepID=A0A1H2PV76_9BURK|nr:hypothetical protein [Chitinasiproducens palmae]SDV51144.1 hypothetical protein SAMN05216551_11563 [Chitinasiproducens palmae]